MGQAPLSIVSKAKQDAKLKVLHLKAKRGDAEAGKALAKLRAQKSHATSLQVLQQQGVTATAHATRSRRSPSFSTERGENAVQAFTQLSSERVCARDGESGRNNKITTTTTTTMDGEGEEHGQRDPIASGGGRA